MRLRKSTDGWAHGPIMNVGTYFKEVETGLSVNLHRLDTGRSVATLFMDPDEARALAARLTTFADISEGKDH